MMLKPGRYELVNLDTGEVYDLTITKHHEKQPRPAPVLRFPVVSPVRRVRRSAPLPA